MMSMTRSDLCSTNKPGTTRCHVTPVSDDSPLFYYTQVIDSPLSYNTPVICATETAGTRGRVKCIHVSDAADQVDFVSMSQDAVDARKCYWMLVAVDAERSARRINRTEPEISRCPEEDHRDRMTTTRSDLCSTNKPGTTRCHVTPMSDDSPLFYHTQVIDSPRSYHTRVICATETAGTRGWVKRVHFSYAADQVDFVSMSQDAVDAQKCYWMLVAVDAERFAEDQQDGARDK
ncbi:hypothetical protein ABVT39_011893 [Epinephelus coioides]